MDFTLHIKDILSKLDSIDLSNLNNADKEARQIMETIGRFPVVENSLLPGKKMMRIRPNCNGVHYLRKCDLSFVPQAWNKFYQRASTPYQTMFYATLMSEHAPVREDDEPTNVCMKEIFKEFRETDFTSRRYQIFTYSIWEVIERVETFPVIYNDDFYKANEYTAELLNYFHFTIDNNPDFKIYKEGTLLLLNYFANHFANPEADRQNQHLYLFSAIFTELISKEKYDGIFYPSVRGNGHLYNVALKPNTVDNKLKLVQAGEMEAYKYDKIRFTDNIGGCAIKLNQSTFEFIPEVTHRKGQAWALNHIGASSINDLIPCS
jgi:hypothetical protein